MSTLRTDVAFFTGVMAFAMLLVCPNLALAGKELIAVSCGAPTVYDSTSYTDVVPVTVTLVNGAPDYVDMTYTAVDSTGAAVSCSPSSDRLSLTKGNPVIDNVSVVYSGSYLPVTFTALGVGEAYGADNDSDEEQLGTFHYGAATRLSVGQGTINFDPTDKPAVVLRYVVPVKISLAPQSKGMVTMTYSASDGSANPVPCIPSVESVVVAGSNSLGNVSYPDAPAVHNVFINAANANPATTVLTVTGTFQNATTTLAYSIGSMTVTQNGVAPAPTLSCGPTKSYHGYSVKVTAVDPGIKSTVTIRYKAIVANSSPVQKLRCTPPLSQIDFGGLNVNNTATVFIDYDDAHGKPVIFSAEGRGTGVIYPAKAMSPFTP